MVPGATGSARSGARSGPPRYFAGSATNFARQPAEQQGVGTPSILRSMRRRVRVHRHAADRIGHSRAEFRLHGGEAMVLRRGMSLSVVVVCPVLAVIAHGCCPGRTRNARVG